MQGEGERGFRLNHREGQIKGLLGRYGSSAVAISLVSVLVWSSSAAIAASVLEPQTTFAVQKPDPPGLPAVCPSPDCVVSASTALGVEGFIEVRLSYLAPGPGDRVILNLYTTSFDQQPDGPGGALKEFEISAYEGTGTPNADAFGSGTFLISLVQSLPECSDVPGAGHFQNVPNSFAIDVTAVYKHFIGRGVEFMGFRLHDAVFLDGPQAGDPAQVFLGFPTGSINPEAAFLAITRPPYPLKPGGGQY
jgi:hypothetical protein